MKEGVIKFELTHQTCSLPQTISLSSINAWRTIMHRLQLIGQNAKKYDGYGYGNISSRIKEKNNAFIVSGTQTGRSENLTAEEYCLVISADPYQNRLNSKGPCKPSSEALTHAIVYQQSTGIKSVIHVHCPEIWNNCDRLSLPYTTENIPYGTPEMAAAVESLFQSRILQQSSIFVMKGHQDGIVSFGPDMQAAAEQLIRCLYHALRIENKAIKS